MQAQDSFIQKKLLYKFDKKIETVFQSLFALGQSSGTQQNGKMLDESEESSKKALLTREGILQQIEWLQFQNFKYRAALISAKKDQTSNEQILKKAQQQIIESKRQVDAISKQLQLSLKRKRNKLQYNLLAQSLKQNYQPLAVQKEQLSAITKQIEQLQNKYLREHSQYQKKQRCLRLALSALKSVIQDQTIQPNLSLPNNDGLYVPQASNSQKTSQNQSNQQIQKGQPNNEDRQQGQQLEGGQILY